MDCNRRVNMILKGMMNNERNPDSGAMATDPVKKLLSHFGDPQDKVLSVHIAGTNGKGSTAVYLQSILSRAGYKTGLYTSPHLIDVTERIQIDRRQISCNELERILNKIILHVNDSMGQLTWFDCITAAAFIYFSEQKCDYMIIETGLGGRLDSTNIIKPECSIITDISIDHIQSLGNTIQDIAIEKAGIIKNGTPVFTSNRTSHVIEVIEKQAASMSTQVYSEGLDFNTTITGRTEQSQLFSFNANFPWRKIYGEKVEIKEILPCQARNCSLAFSAALYIDRNNNSITPELMKDSVYNAFLPGRYEILSHKPRIIYDPAHNAAAVRELMESVSKRNSHGRIYCLFALMKDKDIDTIISIIDENVDQMFCLVLDDIRAAAINNEDRGIKVFDNLKDAANGISSVLKDDDTLIITGTFRIYADALQLQEMLACS